MVKRLLIKTSIFCIGFSLIVYLIIVWLRGGHEMNLKLEKDKDDLSTTNQLKKSCSRKQDLIKKHMKQYCSKIQVN